MKKLFVFGIALGLIPSVVLGADPDLTTTPFFNYLILMFGKVFKDIQMSIFESVRNIYISGTLTAILTLIIFIYAFRKIKEGTFDFPKDAMEVVLFFVMVAFVNYCLNNHTQYSKIVNYLEIPANTIASITTEKINKNLSIKTQQQNNIGGKLEHLLQNIQQNATKMVGSNSDNIFKTSVQIFLKFILWLVYAWFSFIVIASIAVTYILTFLQIAFWKIFGVILIPLIYFKATRGMVIFWGKTIIALSLIGAFMSIVATLAETSEDAILRTLGANYQWEMEKGMGMSYSIIGAIVVSKFILITLLKEIPTMINGMLGTSAAGGTGQFANSVAMGSIGAMGAGAGFAAFKGAMKGGGMARKGLNEGGEAIGKAALGGAKTIADATGATGAAKSIAGNVKSKISNVANSRLGKGVSNIAQGNSAFKDNPKMRKLEDIGLKKD